MGIADKLVLDRQRHLKWRALDKLELILMIICGATLLGFSVSVSLDILLAVMTILKGKPLLGMVGIFFFPISIAGTRASALK